MQRKTKSMERQRAALAAFLTKHVGVEHRDDIGPWLGQAALLDETSTHRLSVERRSHRKAVSVLGELVGMPRRPPRHIAKSSARKRVAR